MSILNKKVIGGVISAIICINLLATIPQILTSADYYSYSDDYGNFLYALGKRESDNEYSIKNTFDYMGRWQLGLSALEDVGFVNYKGKYTPLANSFGIYDDDTFLTSIQGQDYAIYRYHRLTWTYIVNMGLNAYLGTVIQITEPVVVEVTTLINDDTNLDDLSTLISEPEDDSEQTLEENVETLLDEQTLEEIAVETSTDNTEIEEFEVVTTIEEVVVEEINVTVSNLIAGAHLVGVTNLKKYLEGDTTITDSTGTPLTEYMRLFSGYHIEDTIVYGSPFEEVCNCTDLNAGVYTVRATDENAEGIKVYSGHGIYNEVIGYVKNYTSITITQSDGTWAHATLEDGSTGYILLSDMDKFKHIDTSNYDIIVELFKSKGDSEVEYTRTTIDIQ